MTSCHSNILNQPNDPTKSGKPEQPIDRPIEQPVEQPIEQSDEPTNQTNTTTDKKRKSKRNTKSETTTIADYNKMSPDQTCIIYKFQSRPPYEGFILILVIAVIMVFVWWWLNSKLKASEQ
jgi:hypothetical protein